MMHFYKTPKVVSQFLPSLLWKKESTQKELFLTFDDGPIPGLTEEVLTILADYDAKATFFCVGDNIRKHPDIFEKVVAGGHQIGNHTYHHVKGWKNSLDTYLKEADNCQNEIDNLIDGGEKRLFRPPYGQITYNQIKLLKSVGYQIVMWDVLTRDYAADITPEYCLKKSTEVSSSGSIVVFHDNLKARENVLFTLPRYLNHFSDLGYKFSGL